VTPETEAAKRLILGNDVDGPDADRRHYLEQFRDAWTGEQFASHEAFIERWMAWASPIVAINAAAFPWRYPTAGASEALFHVIADIGGLLCRDAMPSLFSNQWFKNLTSLQLGMALIERHDVFDLPRR
jgi:hypothetical protein